MTHQSPLALSIQCPAAYYRSSAVLSCRIAAPDARAKPYCLALLIDSSLPQYVCAFAAVQSCSLLPAMSGLPPLLRLDPAHVALTDHQLRTKRRFQRPRAIRAPGEHNTDLMTKSQLAFLLVKIYDRRYYFPSPLTSKNRQLFPSQRRPFWPIPGTIQTAVTGGGKSGAWPGR
jgi:hypothetical protein